MATGNNPITVEVAREYFASHADGPPLSREFLNVCPNDVLLRMGILAEPHIIKWLEERGECTAEVSENES